MFQRHAKPSGFLEQTRRGGSCGVIARYGVIYPETLENIHCVYLEKGVQDMCVSSPVVAVAGRLGSNYPGHTRAARKKN